MRRRPKTDELLDWEELEQAPNTDGAFSFLRYSAPVIDIQNHRQQTSITSASDPLLNITSTVDVMRLEDRANTKRPYKIHRCYRAQDAHSQGENQLYDALWRLGTPDGPESRKVRIGWIHMGRKAGMSDKAAKRNLGQLVVKLAIEIVAPSNSATRTGRTYRIYSFKVILERRRAANMNFVVRDKGVRFVPCPLNARPGVDLTGYSDSDRTSTVDGMSIDAADKTSIDAEDITSMDTVDVMSMPLGSSLRKQERKTTTTDGDLALVVAALSVYSAVDEDAAQRIITSSRALCGTASAAEIVFAIHSKAPEVVRNRSIRNPLGLLISAVPLRFQGEGLKQLRKELASEQERILHAEQERVRRDKECEEWICREGNR